MLRSLGLAVILTHLAATTAFADPPPSGESLLASLLSRAEALTASLTNIAQNLSRVDGRVVIQTINKGTDLVSVVDELALHHALGPVSRIGRRVYASELSANILDVFKPTQFTLNSAATTAIGALQSGALLGSTGTTGTIDATGIVDRVTITTTTPAAEATIVAEQFGTMSGTVAMQNVAANAGDVDGSIRLRLNDTIAHVGMVATTAIGAMESGVLTADLNGNLQDTSDHLLTVIAALVGP